MHIPIKHIYTVLRCDVYCIDVYCKCNKHFNHTPCQVLLLLDFLFFFFKIILWTILLKKIYSTIKVRILIWKKWGHKEPIHQWFFEEPLKRVLCSTRKGALWHQEKHWFFKEPFTKWFFREPKMVPLWHCRETPFLVLPGTFFFKSVSSVSEHELKLKFTITCGP